MNIKDAFITCVAGDGKPYVKAVFQRLEDAQDFHASLVSPQPAPDLRAVLQRAVEALEPFADFGELLDAETEGFADRDNINVTLGAAIFPNFTFGHFRRARAVLAEFKALEGK